MNWLAFFSYLGIAAGVFGIPILMLPLMMYIEEKIGIYPTLVLIFVTASLVGATIVGVTK